MIELLLLISILINIGMYKYIKYIYEEMANAKRKNLIKAVQEKREVE